MCPCTTSPKSSRRSTIETSEALKAIPDADYELVFVDDGSRDDSYEQLVGFAARDPRVRVIKFARNFGHQVAITAGMDNTQGDCVTVIDADLQDPPEVIAEMVAKWREGFDVVYGRRIDREGESLFKLLTAKVFYRVLNSMVRIDIPTDVGDFRLLSRRAVTQLGRMTEKDRYVRGLVAWIGMKQVNVDYHREARFAGTTKYPFRKMVKFALDGITSFSTVPLRLAIWLGYATSFLGFLYLATVFVQKLAGVTVQGWATIMVAVLFLGGVQLNLSRHHRRVHRGVSSPRSNRDPSTCSTTSSRAARAGPRSSIPFWTPRRRYRLSDRQHPRPRCLLPRPRRCRHQQRAPPPETTSKNHAYCLRDRRQRLHRPTPSSI